MSAKEIALLAIGATAGLTIAAWRTLFPWIGYDLQLLKLLLKNVKAIETDIAANRFFIENFQENVKLSPRKSFIIFEDRSYSYEFVNEQACRVANIVSKWGLQKGDAVGIFAYNGPEYVWTFLGLQKLGVIVTLLNINTKGEPLIHCIRTTDTKSIIVGKEKDLFDTIDSIKNDVDIPIYVMGTSGQENGSAFKSWDYLMMTSYPVEVCSAVRSHLDMHSVCCYFFTSGTTGLPKAALVYNWRITMIAKLVMALVKPPNDVVYDVVPFYHATGCAGWLGAAETGNTVAIRKKFSAAHFFEDCRKHNVTIIFYIGELCRYLLALPESPDDRNHKIRVMTGVGLRKDIFSAFRKRYGIPEICEIYGASESPASFGNIADRPGAIGRISPFLNMLDPNPKYLVKYDSATAEPIRDKNGRCIRVNIGEPGILIGAVPPRNQETFYKGSREMNEKKIVRNAFREGDIYFNSGDLLYLDKDYFVFFYDRLGDTFRWKGENVSTTEVANIITALPFVHDANVYGVSIPGHDGKAGMASITLASNEQPNTKQLKAIYVHCKKSLPKYAIPLVLRFEKETRITATFKQRKVDLVKEGFDPNLISDPMYYLSTSSGSYLPLNSDSHNQFVQSKL